MHAFTRVRLVAFADGAFAPRRERFLREAVRLNVFDDITIFSSATLPTSFLVQHSAFMESHPRGFGHFIWKPQVISLALNQASDDELVVYLDVGFTLNADARPRFLEYLDIAVDSPFKMLSFQNVHTEYRWTKGDLAHRLGVTRTSRIMCTSQLSGGFLILGATTSNKELIREWQEIAVEDGYRYSDDSPSLEPNHPEFVEHRHDQSISSLLRKVRGTTITHYEVQGYGEHFADLMPRLPVWATRLRE
jgi:hypothetical protein